MSDEGFGGAGTEYQQEVVRSPGGRLRTSSAPDPPGQAQARADLERTIEAVTRVMLRPLGNPLPLGFVALAGATLMRAALQIGWIGRQQQQQVAIALIAFVFPLQLLTSILGYLARDTVVGTGMGILSGTWLTVGLILLTSPPGSTGDGLGVFLVLAGGVMLIPASAALLGKLLPAVVLLTTAARFAVTGVYQLTGSEAWKLAAGWVGIVLIVVSLYAAWAGGTRGCPGQASAALVPSRQSSDGRGGYAVGAVVDVHHEPGVKKVL